MVFWLSASPSVRCPSTALLMALLQLQRGGGHMNFVRLDLQIVDDVPGLTSVCIPLQNVCK